MSLAVQGFRCQRLSPGTEWPAAVRQLAMSATVLPLVDLQGVQLTEHLGGHFARLALADVQQADHHVRRERGGRQAEQVPDLPTPRTPGSPGN